ncbi:unnamed protein product [Effrenium voratum]|nr:unnamed protein product [Effrenium voratum]
MLPEWRPLRPPDTKLRVLSLETRPLRRIAARPSPRKECGALASLPFAVGGVLAAHARRVSRGAIPTEYYSLLGLPLFTSDRKEIKSAHRRMVKLVHPDILGADSADLQSIVTEAYNMPPWAGGLGGWKDAPQFAMGVFVDETKCESCYRCVNIASSTFAIHDNPVREGRSYVALQYGDDRYVVREAIGECPAKAIRYVSREDLTKLEYAMTQCATLRHRARPWEKEALPGPWEIYQELMLDELIGMDMEKAVQSQEDPLADTKVAEELGDHARGILEAANRLSEEQRERIWPFGYGSEAAQAKQALEEQNPNIGKRSARGVEQGDARGVQRAEMKATLFYVLDKDGDGFLYDPELRHFAEKFGFEGSDLEWARVPDAVHPIPLLGVAGPGFAGLREDAGRRGRLPPERRGARRVAARVQPAAASQRVTPRFSEALCPGYLLRRRARAALGLFGRRVEVCSRVRM